MPQELKFIQTRMVVVELLKCIKLKQNDDDKGRINLTTSKYDNSELAVWNITILKRLLTFLDLTSWPDKLRARYYCPDYHAGKKSIEHLQWRVALDMANLWRDKLEKPISRLTWRKSDLIVRYLAQWRRPFGLKKVSCLDWLFG